MAIAFIPFGHPNLPLVFIDIIAQNRAPGMEQQRGE